MGGSGFIGSHVIDMLLARGLRVVNFSRSVGPHPHSKVPFVQSDFHNTSKLSEAMEGCETIVHCISETVPATSALDPALDVSTNLVGTIRLLELMKKKSINRLVYLSSGGVVYGVPKETPILESANLSPISSYGAVKVAIENFIGVAQADWGLSAAILRPSNPYGERQGHKGIQGLIGTLLDKSFTGEPVTIFGDGGHVRDYLYVKDLAELVARVIDRPKDGVFNCGSGEGWSTNQIIQIVEKVTGVELEKRYVGARSFDVPTMILDNSKAFEAFGWKSDTPMSEGIQCQLSALRQSL